MIVAWLGVASQEAPSRVPMCAVVLQIYSMPCSLITVTVTVDVCGCLGTPYVTPGRAGGCIWGLAWMVVADRWGVSAAVAWFGVQRYGPPRCGQVVLGVLDDDVV